MTRGWGRLAPVVVCALTASMLLAVPAHADQRDESGVLDVVVPGDRCFAADEPMRMSAVRLVLPGDAVLSGHTVNWVTQVGTRRTIATALTDAEGVARPDVTETMTSDTDTVLVVARDSEGELLAHSSIVARRDGVQAAFGSVASLPLGAASFGSAFTWNGTLPTTYQGDAGDLCTAVPEPGATVRVEQSRDGGASWGDATDAVVDGARWSVRAWAVDVGRLDVRLVMRRDAAGGAEKVLRTRTGLNVAPERLGLVATFAGASRTPESGRWLLDRGRSNLIVGLTSWGASERPRPDRDRALALTYYPGDGSRGVVLPPTPLGRVGATASRSLVLSASGSFDVEFAGNAQESGFVEQRSVAVRIRPEVRGWPVRAVRVKRSAVVRRTVTVRDDWEADARLERWDPKARRWVGIVVKDASRGRVTVTIPRHQGTARYRIAMIDQAFGYAHRTTSRETVATTKSWTVTRR